MAQVQENWMDMPEGPRRTAPRNARSQYGADGCCDIIVRILRVVSILTALALAWCQIFSFVIDVKIHTQTITVHWITTLLLRIASIGFCSICTLADCACIRRRSCVPQAFVNIVDILEYWSVRGIFYFFVGLLILEMSYDCHSYDIEGLARAAMGDTLLWIMWVSALIMCGVGTLYFLFSLLCINRCLKSNEASLPPDAGYDSIA